MKLVFIEPAATEANVYSKLHMPLLGPVYIWETFKFAVMLSFVLWVYKILREWMERNRKMNWLLQA